MNIKTNVSRDCSTSISFNSSKKASIISAGSSMDYVEQVQVKAQANELSWTEQVKREKDQSPFNLFYIFLNKTTPNTTSIGPVFKYMHISHMMKINSENMSQYLINAF